MLYKLTDQDGYTRLGETNACLWGPGVLHSGTGKGRLCGDGYIHAYTSPLLAVLMNPVHACISDPRMWEAEGDIMINDGMKVGCVTLTTTKEIDVPAVSTDQRVRFGILCAKAVCLDVGWNTWADNWLSGKDRAQKEAETTATREETTDSLFARAAARAAVWAAVWACEAAARTVAGARAAAAECADAVAARAASACVSAAAEWAATSADLAVDAGGRLTLNLAEIAERAMEEGGALQ